jgi:hypothetical protein
MALMEFALHSHFVGIWLSLKLNQGVIWSSLQLSVLLQTGTVWLEHIIILSATVPSLLANWCGGWVDHGMSLANLSIVKIFSFLNFEFNGEERLPRDP